MSTFRPPYGWLPIRLLTANVGNVNLGCWPHYNNKLCNLRVEDAITKNIKIIEPDIVFFQELLHPDQCKGWLERNQKSSCYKSAEIESEYQPRRLLGNSYSIACSARMNLKKGYPLSLYCIGVSVKIGSIEGCEKGNLCLNIGRQNVTISKCNSDFITHSVIAKLHGLKVNLVNVHSESRNIKCRNSALRQIFEGTNNHQSLALEKYNIIAGDFNLDPFRGKDNFLIFWNKYVGPNGSETPFYYLSGPTEHQPPYPTTRVFFQQKTVDLVLTDFALGTSTTLGEATGTTGLDNGLGMDHRAILCDLWMPPRF